MRDTDRRRAERVTLARAAAPLASSFDRFERVLVLWRAVRQWPWLIAAPVALLMLWRPRAALRLLAAMPMLWRFGRLVP
ncbi:MAG: hypothetical protein Q8L49_02430 [Burkholderiaceae bacterium]|nr:hypothetical protein [Burkholderiaceae bacterium]